MAIIQNRLTLSKPFPIVRDLWVDPITGLAVPKEKAANLRWRGKLLERARADTGFRQEIYNACSESLLFWINSFAWTNRLFITGPDGVVRQCGPKEANVPFITWDIQNEHISLIEEHIRQGVDLLTDKSRDMGATWDHIVVFDWEWLFKSDRSFLMISRKENCVDSSGKKGLGSAADPGTLFGKLDYLHTWLPEWMLPPHTRTTMHLVNLMNRSRIDGESANATAGSSDRRTAILLDEMAKMAEGESIKRSTRDVTACRLPNSTPNGAGTAYTKWCQGGQIEVFRMGWWNHPEKGNGRYIEEDQVTGVEKIRSPYYNHEETVRTPKEMSIELDMDHVGSGDTFFEPESILKHRSLFVRPPVQAGLHVYLDPAVPLEKIPQVIRANDVSKIKVEHLKNGPLKLWINLIDGRPDQSLNYIFGIDIGKGMGASNSVVSVGCAETKQKVAEWASANFAPHDFAVIVVALAVWFGGSQRGKRPFTLYEANGDTGIYFGKTFVKTLQYPNCYIDRHTVDALKTAKGRKYGWHSSPEKKADLLGDYRRALCHATLHNPSDAALSEAESYIYFPGGEIGPATLVEESASARKTHGDRVIADALMNKGLLESRIRVIGGSTPPVGSMAERYQKEQQRRREAKKQETWDFRR